MASIKVARHTLTLIVRISLADIVLLFALLVRVFSENAAWRLACWTASWFWGYMQHHWENTLNASGCLTITGDEIPHEEPAFVLANHLGYSDYYLVQALASRKGMLGRCRYFVKKEITRIPFFGPAFWAIGMILVSRNWTNDHKLIQQAFSRIKKNEHAAWIVLYPEGTRRTEKKLIEAQGYARLHGLPELNHLLLPRTKGFISTVQSLSDSHIQHIYDLTFLYTSPGKDSFRIPALDEQLASRDLAKAGYTYRIHVRRWAIKDLPVDEKGLREWCVDTWASKDRLLQEMMREVPASSSSSEEGHHESRSMKLSKELISRARDRRDKRMNMSNSGSRVASE